MFTNNFQILIDEDEADNGSPIVPVTENKKKAIAQDGTSSPIHPNTNAAKRKSWPPIIANEPQDDPKAKTIAYQDSIGISTGPGRGEANNHDSYVMGVIDPDALFSNDQIKTIFKNTNEKVKSALGLYDQDKTGEDKESGCTALLCMVQAKGVVVAHAGDCKATLVYKKNGQYHLKHLTTPHRLSNSIEIKRVDANQQTLDSQRLSTFDNRKVGIMPTRGFGAENYIPGFIPEPEIINLEEDIDLNEAYIIGSTDGFWEHISDQALLRKFNNKEFINSSLTNKANQLRKQAYFKKEKDEYINGDNITVCVARATPGVLFGVTDGFGVFGGVAARSAIDNLHDDILKYESVNLLDPQVQFEVASINLLNMMKNKTATKAEQIQALVTFHNVYVSLPWWREYSYTLTLVICIVVGAIIGTLLGVLYEWAFNASGRSAWRH